jgi:hypothetical protein
MAPLRAVLSVVAVALLAAPSPAQELLNDTKLGFKLKAPGGFTKVPLKPEEEWIVARWISDRAYFQNDKSGFSVDHKPELNVIAFPSDKVKTHVQEEKSGTGEQSHTTIILKNPFKDYRDYLKRTYNEGGFYVAKEDKAEVEGVAVEVLEIKVEKLTFGGPRKIVTWIFKNDDVDFAVQFEMVESAWAKLKGDVTSCMRSFRRIAKDAGGPSGAAPSTRDAFENTGDLSPAQRTARRRESEKVSQDKFIKNLTEGWTAKKYGRVFVLSHVDEKYAARVAENANAVLDYLDSNLGYIGPGEYVRAPVIRICKDYDEMRVYDKGGSGGIGAIISIGGGIPEFVFDREITTYKDLNGNRGGDSTLSSICQHWLREHDESLYAETPRWLRIGLMRSFEMSRSKGGKLEFYNDSDERVGISQQVHSGKLSKVQDLVKMDPEALWNDRNRYDECAAATRFLLTGPKKAKDALVAYVGAVNKIARKDEEERKKKAKSSLGESKPKTIEEEDAKFKEASTKERDSEKVHLEEVYAAAFGTWSEADWKSFQSVYEKSIN